MGYYDSSFVERHPSVHIGILAIGIGIVAAIATSSTVALCQWFAGMPWGEVLDGWFRLTVLLLPTLPTMLATISLLKYYSEVVRVSLPQKPIEPGDPLPIVESIGERASLPSQVVESALIQLTWYYRDHIEPTREIMCEEFSWINQQLWNSGRRICREMGLVDGKQWVRADWVRVKAISQRLVVDEDTIWVPDVGARSMHRVTINSTGDNNSYIVEPPTPPEGETG